MLRKQQQLISIVKSSWISITFMSITRRLLLIEGEVRIARIRLIAIRTSAPYGEDIVGLQSLQSYYKLDHKYNKLILISFACGSLHAISSPSFILDFMK